LAYPSRWLRGWCCCGCARRPGHRCAGPKWTRRVRGLAVPPPRWAHGLSSLPHRQLGDLIGCRTRPHGHCEHAPHCIDEFSVSLAYMPRINDWQFGALRIVPDIAPSPPALPREHLKDHDPDRPHVHSRWELPHLPDEHLRDIYGTDPTRQPLRPTHRLRRERPTVAVGCRGTQLPGRRPRWSKRCVSSDEAPRRSRARSCRQALALGQEPLVQHTT